MNICILSSTTNATGNLSTAIRIKNFLHNDNVVISDTPNFTSDLIIGIHAYRAGKLLLNSPIPYIIVFGGTDLNIDVYDSNKYNIMKKCVTKAKQTIVFSNVMKKLSYDYFNIQSTIISPSVDVIHSTLNCPININKFTILFLTGIRPVKDVLFTLYNFSEWHLNDPSVQLLIYGPILDKEYADVIFNIIDKLPGIYYKGTVHSQHAHFLVQNADIILNSSISEGLCTSILEAMFLSTVVLARNIPSNADIIQHKQNGFLYDNPEEAISSAKFIKNNPTIVDKITYQANNYVTKNHNYQQEELSYQKMVTNSFK